MSELTADLNKTFAAFEKTHSRQIAFTADASHELRTPLTALITQNKRGLKGQRTEEEYQKIFKVIDRAAQRLKHIVDNLLELSRYDAGRIILEKEELALNNLLADMAEDYRPMVEEQGGKLVCDLQSCVVLCDPFRLEQVIANFISNAVKHNSHPVTVTLRCRAENGLAIIQVEDNGKGISQENLDLLFDRFFQEQKSRAGNGLEGISPNAGLGLSISKVIVEAHGGCISVTSEPNVRTVFEVRMPGKS